MQKKTISNIFIISFEILFLVLIVGISLKIVHLYNQLYIQEENRYKMMEKAEQLTHSSDNLTHFARSYVVTTKKYFKDRYFDVLNIRDGKLAIPENYNSVYWNNVDLSDSLKPLPNSKKEALNKQMRKLPYTKTEIMFLTKAEAESNDLVNLEKEAFNAMQSYFKNSDGGYDKHNKANQEYAIKLLYSAPYYQAKMKIMQPINDFISSLDTRTQENIKTTLSDIQFYRFLGISFICIFIIGNIVVYLYLDILKKQLTQKKHELLQKTKLAQMGETISMIAHQWTQPLSSINVISNTIQADILLNNTANKSLLSPLKELNELVEQLSHTVYDFKNYFKPRKTKNIFNLEDVVDKALRLNKSLFTNSNILLQTSFATQIKLESFENEILQAILNILKNALDAIESKGIQHPKIFLSTEEKENNAILKITDNAGGIPSDIIEKIFEPYFSTKSKSGTGLGLYMSKQIIEDHCMGSLDFHNGKNESVFTIKLPIYQKN